MGDHTDLLPVWRWGGVGLRTQPIEVKGRFSFAHADILLKRKPYLIRTLIVISNLVMPVVGLQSSSLHISSRGMISYSPFLGKGVNYLSLYHMYSSEHTTNDILHRDFSQFQRDGINVISLSLYWYRLEGNTRGDYDGEYKRFPEGIGGSYGERFLEDVKRAISIAHEYGIGVLVAFNTLWGSDSTWCTPDYVIDPVTGENIGLAVVRSEDMKQAFISMFNYTVRCLAHTPGIWAWAVLNEPWYWPHELPPPYQEVNQKENFIDLIKKLSDIVKTLDGKPITVKFPSTHTWIKADGVPMMKNIFVDDWSWDQRIFDALNFISFNSYITKHPELYSTWKNFTTEDIVGSFQRSQRVWITECGLDSDNGTIQADNYRNMIDLYETLPIDGCIAWFWESDHDEPGIWGGPGRGMNVCADANTGEGRQAYRELIRFNPEV